MRGPGCTRHHRFRIEEEFLQTSADFNCFSTYHTVSQKFGYEFAISHSIVVRDLQVGKARRGITRVTLLWRLVGRPWETHIDCIS